MNLDDEIKKCILLYKRLYKNNFNYHIKFSHTDSSIENEWRADVVVFDCNFEPDYHSEEFGSGSSMMNSVKSLTTKLELLIKELPDNEDE